MAYTKSLHQLALEFACKPNKPIFFIERDAYLARKEVCKGPFLCSVKQGDPNPILHNNEPVLRYGKVVGYVTSGAYGYTLGRADGLCLVSLPDGETDVETLKTGEFAVVVEG